MPPTGTQFNPNNTTQSFPIDEAIRILQETMPAFEQPLITGMNMEYNTPFNILIATILSLRTKDTMTAVVAPRLFAVANTPEAMVSLTEEELAKLIYPVGFYRTKASNILAICQILLEKYAGNVPDSLEELLKLPGVGRKTANLVVTKGYDLPGICVDTHVHRISNRWGYVQTRSPDETEMALRAKLPQQYWIDINALLVTLGQQICHPLSPKCSQCPVAHLCARVGVVRSR